MTLSVGIIGDNPQQPYISAETYVPDQLMAGNLKVVSDNGIVSGAATLPRGAVMGVSKFGSVISSTGKVQASGTVIVAAVPTSGDTVTIQGTAITFNTPLTSNVNEIADPLQVLFTSSMTTAQIAQAFLAALNAAATGGGPFNGVPDANLSKLSYSLSGSTITATALIAGTAGNAYTLVTSDSGAFTVSGATLASGANNTGTATIGSVSAGKMLQAGNYIVTLTSATQGNVIDPSGEMLGVMTMGTAFVDPQINFTITTGGSPAVGDAFYLYSNPNAPGIYKLAVATATDGSEVPFGLLADFVDPTGGNVNAGIYLMGEFNGNAIVYDSSFSPQTVKSALLATGRIFIKNVVSASDPI